MADYTIKAIDKVENYHRVFYAAGKSLGVTAFGINIEKYPATHDKYPEHDHAEDQQEEVYIVTEGGATLTIDGKDHELKAGMMARVGAQHKRKITPGPEGVTIIAVGGTPGKAFKPAGK